MKFRNAWPRRSLFLYNSYFLQKNFISPNLTTSFTVKFPIKWEIFAIEWKSKFYFILNIVFSLIKRLEISILWIYLWSNFHQEETASLYLNGQNLKFLPYFLFAKIFVSTTIKLHWFDFVHKINKCSSDLNIFNYTHNWNQSSLSPKLSYL